MKVKSERFVTFTSNGGQLAKEQSPRVLNVLTQLRDRDLNREPPVHEATTPTTRLSWQITKYVLKTFFSVCLSDDCPMHCNNMFNDRAIKLEIYFGPYVCMNDEVCRAIYAFITQRHIRILQVKSFRFCDVIELLQLEQCIKNGEGAKENDSVCPTKSQIVLCFKTKCILCKLSHIINWLLFHLIKIARNHGIISPV